MTMSIRPVRSQWGRGCIIRCISRAQSPGVGVGASVQLLGIEVGRVSDVRIEYDRASHILQTPVILEIRPNTISGLVASNQMDMTVYVNGALTYLVARGLRARLSSSNLITGQRQVNLEFVNDASTYIVS
jgi:paraquat-inducible protein B